MIRKWMLLVTGILLAGVLTFACNLPSASNMRQVDYGSLTQEEVADGVMTMIDDLIDDIQGNANPGETVSITLTEAQITAVIAEKLEDDPSVPISNVLINVDPDKIIIAATIDKDGTNYNIVTEVFLTLNNYTLSIEIGDFTVSGFPASVIPGVREWFVNQVESALVSALLDRAQSLESIELPEYVTDINLGEGQLTVYGVVPAEE